MDSHLVPEANPADWVEGVPTSGRGQVCALCASRDVAWVHPLAAHLVTYREHGKQHTLPTFWVLCDRCEQLHTSGNVDAAIDPMRAAEWSWVPENDVAECIVKPLEVFRRADRGAQRLES